VTRISGAALLTPIQRIELMLGDKPPLSPVESFYCLTRWAATMAVQSGRNARRRQLLGGWKGVLMANVTRRGVLAIAATSAFALTTPALADAPAPFSANEIVDDGNRFFGALSRGMADVVQEAASRWGLPNAYILGQEASGAFVGGLRYGEGKMYTRNAGNERVFWQGPSLGFDAGADGDRTMMLVYNLPATGAIFDRFGGLDGSAYFVGGLGFTALGAKGVVVVPIRTGLGWRLGVNLNYLKFTQEATWNPF
jgi:hypothetical protein